MMDRSLCVVNKHPQLMRKCATSIRYNSLARITYRREDYSCEIISLAGRNALACSALVNHVKFG